MSQGTAGSSHGASMHSCWQAQRMQQSYVDSRNFSCARAQLRQGGAVGLFSTAVSKCCFLTGSVSIFRINKHTAVFGTSKYSAHSRLVTRVMKRPVLAHHCGDNVHSDEQQTRLVSKLDAPCHSRGRRRETATTGVEADSHWEAASLCVVQC